MRAIAAIAPIALIALSAVLYGLAFPPTRVRILAWVALAPLFIAIRGGTLRRALLLTWLWCLFAAYAVGDWFPGAVSNYYEQPTIVGWALFTFVVTVMAAPYYCAFAAAYRGLSRLSPVWLPVFVAAAWVSAELLRGRLLTGSPFLIGNPWALVGYSQVGWAHVVQVASLAGVYGVSFAIAALNAAFAELTIAIFSSPEERRLSRQSLGALLAATPLLMVLVYGAASLSSNAEEVAEEPTRIAVVQGNLALGSRWRAEHYGKNLDIYLALTRAAIERAEPRVVFWPEAAMTFLLEEEPVYRAAIERTLAEGSAELVAGGVRNDRGPGRERFFNSVFFLSPESPIQSYDKQYLVPFSEYFPFRSIEFLRRRFERVDVLTPGASPSLLPTAAGQAGVAICNETLLPEVVAQRVEAGAEFLVNPSNDSWIPEPRFAEQQLDVVTLRAIEQRRWLVRASTSGPSAIVDPWGRVLGRTAMGEQKILVGDVSRRSGRSFYLRAGDLFGALALLATLAGLVFAARKAKPKAPSV